MLRRKSIFLLLHTSIFLEVYVIIQYMHIMKNQYPCIFIFMESSFIVVTITKFPFNNYCTFHDSIILGKGGYFYVSATMRIKGIEIAHMLHFNCHDLMFVGVGIFLRYHISFSATFLFRCCAASGKR